jgi:hypothetical protein
MEDDDALAMTDEQLKSDEMGYGDVDFSDERLSGCWSWNAFQACADLVSKDPPIIDVTVKLFGSTIASGKLTQTRKCLRNTYNDKVTKVAFAVCANFEERVVYVNCEYCIRKYNGDWACARSGRKNILKW